MIRSLALWRQWAVFCRDMMDPMEPRRSERKQPRVVGADGPIVGRTSDCIIMDDPVPRSDMVEELEAEQAISQGGDVE